MLEPPGATLPPLTSLSNVTNLSALQISKSQQEMLERGLTFIPTPPLPDRDLLRRDIHSYHRRLKILDYFDFNTNCSFIPFISPSNWEPSNQSISQPICEIIKQDLRSFRRLRFSRPKTTRNINNQQQQAINKLKSQHAIIIKPADKGGQIVLQDRTNYILEATRQLTDTSFYRPISEPMYLETQTIVRTLIDEMLEKKHITSKQAHYLYGPDLPRARLFYLLPKIHKPPSQWTVPFVVPTGRPIVSDCGSETYNIAEFIDYYINPLSHTHPSYIKDTYTFVNKLKNLTVPENTFLFSVDVESLYTNIDTTLGIEAVRKALASSPDPSRPDHYILQFLHITLTRNDFLFDTSFFLQTSGCAMGRKYSPAYADIYLADWEHNALLKCPIRPLVYFRYLDDIFGLWDKSETEFLHFIQTLNSHHPRIKLKHTLHPQQVPFLDTIVFFTEAKQGNKSLATKVYFKDTDRHSLLYSTSYHPRHTFTSIIKSQLIRFNRICSFPHDVEEATRILFKALRPRGYSKRFLRSVKAEVSSLLQPGHHSILPVKNKNTNHKLVPFITTFSLQLGPLNQTIKQHFNSTIPLINTPTPFKILFSYRRNKNLGDILVHTALNKTIPTTLDPYFTNHKYISNSRACAPIWQTFTLLSHNVIYAIQCKLCKSMYIGETGATIKQRLHQHIYHIQKGTNNKLLYTHFASHTIINFSLCGLETNLGWTPQQRRAAERKWICRLSSRSPFGLNDDNPSHPSNPKPHTQPTSISPIPLPQP